VEDHTQILFGTSVDGKMGNRMSVTLISSLAADGSVPIAPVPSARPVAASKPIVEAPPPSLPIVPEIIAALPPEPLPNEHNTEEMVSAQPVAEIIPPPVPVRPERKPAPRREPELTPDPAAAKPPPAKKDRLVQARQEVMQFEPVTRGRFEKSEPTIVEGQDLDVPTYLRKHVPVK